MQHRRRRNEVKVKVIIVAAIALLLAGVASADRIARQSKPHVIPKHISTFCYFIDRRAGETFADASLSPKFGDPTTPRKLRGRVAVRYCLKAKRGKTGAQG